VLQDAGPNCYIGGMSKRRDLEHALRELQAQWPGYDPDGNTQSPAVGRKRRDIESQMEQVRKELAALDQSR
jgi:hypothetical protein